MEEKQPPALRRNERNEHCGSTQFGRFYLVRWTGGQEFA
jgi:hypothetical protein